MDEVIVLSGEFLSLYREEAKSSTQPLVNYLIHKYLIYFSSGDTELRLCLRSPLQSLIGMECSPNGFMECSPNGFMECSPNGFMEVVEETLKC